MLQMINIRSLISTEKSIDIFIANDNFSINL